MKSPITGKEMLLQQEQRSLTFRKEEFTIHYHYYECTDSGTQFTTDDLDTLNLNQVYNLYREKHKLPFPDEIIELRKLYGLSATKMAEVLGFGINVYRNYENGEVPSESNARLIQMIQEPSKFRELIKISGVYEKSDLAKVLKKIDALIEEQSNNSLYYLFGDYLLGNKSPDKYSGYRKPSLDRLIEMIVFFAEQLQPWKTKLNKLLFYADFSHFKRTGYSISGMRYCAINLGPVPNNFQSLFEQIARNHHVDIEVQELGDNMFGEQFKAHEHRSFEADTFTSEEIDTLQRVANKFWATTGKSLINMSHEEDGWKKNKDNKTLISYEDAFSLKVDI